MTAKELTISLMSQDTIPLTSFSVS